MALALGGCGGSVQGSPGDGGSALGDATSDAIGTGDSIDAPSLLEEAGADADLDADATVSPGPDGSAAAPTSGSALNRRASPPAAGLEVRARCATQVCASAPWGALSICLCADPRTARAAVSARCRSAMPSRRFAFPAPAENSAAAEEEAVRSASRRRRVVRSCSTPAASARRTMGATRQTAQAAASTAFALRVTKPSRAALAAWCARTAATEEPAKWATALAGPLSGHRALETTD